MGPEIDLVFVFRLILNAEALLDEAVFLSNGKFWRRSAFLALSSYEEIAKLKLYLQSFQSEQKPPLHFHSEKFKEFRGVFATCLKEIERFNTFVVDGKEVSHEEFKEQPNYEEFLKSYHKVFMDAFDPKKLREALLYEDISSNYSKQLLKSPHFQEQLCLGLLKIADNSFKPIRALFTDENKEKCVAFINNN